MESTAGSDSCGSRCKDEHEHARKMISDAAQTRQRSSPQDRIRHVNRERYMDAISIGDPIYTGLWYKAVLGEVSFQRDILHDLHEISSIRERQL